MTRAQRRKHETFVRVRDFGAANRGIFPESSTAGLLFARVASAVAAIERYLTARVIARSEAGKMKATTRTAVFEYLKTIASTGRRATRLESSGRLFRIPPGRSGKAIVATARAFLTEATAREAEFIRLGLPTTFVGDFQALVDGLDRAIDTRLNGVTARRKAQAGIESALVDGFEAITELDVVVPNALREDPVRLAEWRRARHIDRERPSAHTAAEAAAGTEKTSARPSDEKVDVLAPVS